MPTARRNQGSTGFWREKQGFWRKREGLDGKLVKKETPKNRRHKYDKNIENKKLASHFHKK